MANSRSLVLNDGIQEISLYFDAPVDTASQNFGN
jgi:hypothetical protein